MNDRSPATGELDHDAEALLAAFCREEALPEDIGERVWARVEHDTSPETTRRLWMRRAAIASLAAAAALTLVWVSADAIVHSRPRRTTVAAAHHGEVEAGGGIATVVGHAPPRQPTPGQVREQDRAGEPEHDGAMPSASGGNSPTPPGAAEAEDSSGQSDDAPRPDPRRRARSERADDDRSEPPEAPTSPIEDSASRLGDEVALIQRARQALLNGKPSDALRLLQRHQEEFSTGAMARDREALQAIATCRLHGAERGQTKAEQFLRMHGTSALAERVRKECEVR